MRAKNQIILRGMGVGAITFSFLLAIGYFFFNQQLFHFFETYFSSDHEITANGIRELASTYFFGAFLLLGIGYVLYRSASETWRAKMIQVIMNEPSCRLTQPRLSPQRTLILSTIAGLALIILMRLAYKVPAIYPILFAKDHGIVDVLVPITMASSSILIGISLWKMWKNQSFTKQNALPLLGYLFLAMLLLIYAGEEISWGQDFLGWQTPEIFAGNLESQTNLHNYFNPYFDYGYIAISLIVIVMAFAVWLESNQRMMPYGRLLLPHPAMMGLGLLIAFVSIVWFHEQELLEEMVAVFVLFYSLRVFMNLRHPNLLIKSCQHETNCRYWTICKNGFRQDMEQKTS